MATNSQQDSSFHNVLVTVYSRLFESNLVFEQIRRNWLDAHRLAPKKTVWFPMNHCSQRNRQSKVGN